MLWRKKKIILQNESKNIWLKIIVANNIYKNVWRMKKIKVTNFLVRYWKCFYFLYFLNKYTRRVIYKFPWFFIFCFINFIIYFYTFDSMMERYIDSSIDTWIYRYYSTCICRLLFFENLLFYKSHLPVTPEFQKLPSISVS